MMVTAGDVGVLAKLGCGTQYRMPFNNEENLEESYIEGVRLIGKKSQPGTSCQAFCKTYFFASLAGYFGPPWGLKEIWTGEHMREGSLRWQTSRRLSILAIFEELSSFFGPVRVLTARWSEKH